MHVVRAGSALQLRESMQAAVKGADAVVMAAAVADFRPLTVAMIDIDDFKSVNDGHSHQVGDRVLKTIAHLLVTTVRERDIAARLAGDEFVVLFESPEGGGERDRDLVERVHDALRDPLPTSVGTRAITASVGAGRALVGEDPSAVLARADAAARRADLMLAVGTTLGVYPIANVVPLARAHGAPVVIVNGGPTEMDDLADVRIEGSISEVLPRLVD